MYAVTGNKHRATSDWHVTAGKIVTLGEAAAGVAHG